MSRQNTLTLITTHCALTDDPSCVTVALGYTQPHYSQVRTHMKFATIYQRKTRDRRLKMELNAVERWTSLGKKRVYEIFAIRCEWLQFFMSSKWGWNVKAISANFGEETQKRLGGSRFFTPFGWFSTVRASMIQRLDLFTRSFSIWCESS